MKFLINKIDEQEVDDFGSDGYLESETGDFYSYQLEYGTNPGGLDEVALSDGCNRYIPIYIENIPQVIAALCEAFAIHKEIQAGKQLEEDALSDLEGYITNHNISY